jgi:hypothetical protein
MTLLLRAAGAGAAPALLLYCRDTLGMGKVAVTMKVCPSSVDRAPHSQK